MQTLSVDQLVGQTLGRYRVERLLGKGRLQAIYLARNLSLQRTDALTLYIIPERFSADAYTRFLTRFRKDAPAITSLVHPHIMPVFEYGEYSGYPYLVTPYMMHGSLADMLKQKGRYEYSDVEPILNQLVAGIACAHNQGFIHGTLKPSNVVSNGDDTMLVAGFGLMHLLQISGIEQTDQPYAHLLSVANTFLAAPEYIAPEVVQGQSIDARSDIYALGCILFELLSGKPPFSGAKPMEIAKQHVTQTIPPLRSFYPDIPSAVASVINQALDRDPGRRFQNVNELGEAFTQAVRGATGEYKPVGRDTSTAKRSGRLQETPKDGYTTLGNWQLMPPIVTSKVPALPPPTGKFGKAPTSPNRKNPPGYRSAPPTLVNTDDWQEAPATTRDLSAKQLPVEPPAPVLPPVVPEKPPMPLAPPQPPPQAKPAAPGAFNSLLGVQEDPSELAKAYGWWSDPGVSQSAPQPAMQSQRIQPPPAQSQGMQQQAIEPPVRSLPPQQEPLRLGAPAMDMADWASQTMNADFGRPRRPMSPARQAKKVKRRQVVALLATGVAAVAGTAYFVNRQHIFATNAAPPTAMTTQQQTNNTNTTARPTTTTAGQTGTKIGTSAQAIGTAVAFTNPADQKASLLIHLPTGTFAAYERACTHMGVLVNYDAATNTLVCPLHNSIFNPGDGGKVLQGPATVALAKVNIKVNADGSITTV